MLPSWPVGLDVGLTLLSCGVGAEKTGDAPSVSRPRLPPLV
jgi:hypothetical protein